MLGTIYLLFAHSDSGSIANGLVCSHVNVLIHTQIYARVIKANKKQPELRLRRTKNLHKIIIPLRLSVSLCLIEYYFGTLLVLIEPHF